MYTYTYTSIPHVHLHPLGLAPTHTYIHSSSSFTPIYIFFPSLQKYAGNNGAFLKDLSECYLKLTTLGFTGTTRNS